MAKKLNAALIPGASPTAGHPAQLRSGRSSPPEGTTLNAGTGTPRRAGWGGRERGVSTLREIPGSKGS